MNKKLNLVITSGMFIASVLLLYYFAEITRLFIDAIFTVDIPQKALSTFIWLSLSFNFANFLMLFCCMVFLPNMKVFLNSLDDNFGWKNKVKSWLEKHGLS